MRVSPRLEIAGQSVAAAIAFVSLAWLALDDGGLADARLGQLLALLGAVPLYLAAGGWRLPWWIHLAAVSLPLSLTAVALLHADPVGGARITRYASFAVLLLGVLALASTPRRRLLIAGGIGALGAVLLGVGLAGALAAGDPGRYLDGGMWTNTFGAAMAMIGALGLGIAVLTPLAATPGRTRLESLALALGWLAAVAGIAGTVMSASRVSLVLLGLAAIALLALGVRAGRWRAALRWGIAIGAGALTTVVLRLPALLPVLTASPQQAAGALEEASSVSSANPIAAIVKPGASESWTQRLDYWRLAWQMGWDHPVIGVGLSRYGSDLQVCYERGAGASDPHSELLRAWADGGLVALLPMLAAFLGAAVIIIAALRLLGARDGRQRLLADPARWAASAGVGVAAAHLAVDFDWAYPLMIGLAAVLAGLAAAAVVQPKPRARAGADDDRGPWHVMGRIVLIAGIVVIGLVALRLDPYGASPLIFTSFPPGTISCE